MLGAISAMRLDAQRDEQLFGTICRLRRSDVLQLSRQTGYSIASYEAERGILFDCAATFWLPFS